MKEEPTIKKAMFLIFHGMSEANGISKKISYQVQALKDCGLDVQFCHYDVTSEGNRRWIADKTVLANWKNSIISKLKKRFYYKPILDFVKKEKFSFIYIRSDHNANPFTIYLIKQMKKHGAKVVMEIPTYPYDQEYLDFRMKCELSIDRIFRRFLAKELSGIVTFSSNENIFGKRTIRISNGIDFSRIPIKKRINDTSESLNLLGVAEIHYWHGFDRIIKGLSLYYQNPTCYKYKVYFHIVGLPSGEREQKEVVEYIKETHLEDFVILHGAKYGNDLNQLFDQADIAIGSLGRHRCNIDKIKTLKNREYAARGIPFIYSETDDDFENKPYILKMPASESAINIQDIISFSKRVDPTPERIRNSIADLSWKKQMERVIAELNL